MWCPTWVAADRLWRTSTVARHREDRWIPALLGGGSRRQRLAEALDQAGEVARGRRRVLQGLLVRERLTAHPLREVGDRRDRRHAQAAVAGEDDLGPRRHADGVGAERAEG